MLTTKELAKELKVSTRTIEGWRLNGLGPRYVRVSNRIRYKESDIIHYMSKNSVKKVKKSRPKRKYKILRIKIY